MKLAPTLLAAILIAACSSSSSSTSDSAADYDALSKLDVKAQIALVDRWQVDKPTVTSFVTSKELDVKFPDGRELKTSLPAAEMYVAVAPYVHTTHPCTIHYPSNCHGELVSATFHLTTKDETGAQLFDGDVTSLENGFFELWLPRDKTLSVHITQGSLAADVTIPTAADSPTCVTTANLK